MGDTFEIAYEDLIHGYEGMMIEYPNCEHGRPFLKHLASHGCHMCDFGPVDVLLKKKDNE